MFEKLNSARLLNQIKQTARRLLGAQGEANAQSIAIKLIEQYESLGASERKGFFNFLAEEFNPDPQEVLHKAQSYAQDPSAAHLIALFKVTEPGRQELLRRINRAPNGTSAIINMRRELLPLIKDNKEWSAIDSDMLHLLGSWFNPGFLELHEITWHSSAQLLEKIIQHEAVHAIDGWDDLHRRLQPDRRCFAFFHPQLPEEPLIFVEVALVPEISQHIDQLLDRKTPVGEQKSYKTAIFYSISNCQPGLRGVSLGNFLIKRVANKLQQEIPTLKNYCTLSPIPGFTKWLDQGCPLQGIELPKNHSNRIDEAISLLKIKTRTWKERLKEGWHPDSCTPSHKNAMLLLCAAYLRYGTHSAGGDSVANFHLSNGATLHQINWAADRSAKGLQQSAGMMVNYLYELNKVEVQHEAYGKGEVILSRSVKQLI